MIEWLRSQAHTGLKFLMTYKMSQDHIELFFGQIRSMGGCNKNPTARQFSAAYKKLLLHHEIQDISKSKCVPLQSVPILTASSNSEKSTKFGPSAIDAINNSLTKNIIFDRHELDNLEDTYPDIQVPYLSEYSEKVVAYIAGFVVYKLKKKLYCESCISALTAPCSLSVHTLIAVKNKGGLIFPSLDVIKICQCCEKNFRSNVTSLSSNPYKRVVPYNKQKIVQCVLISCSNKNVFSELLPHMTNTDPLSNHLLLLIRAICEIYLDVRYSYAGKQYTYNLQEMKCCKSRQSQNKLVLFSGL